MPPGGRPGKPPDGGAGPALNTTTAVVDTWTTVDVSAFFAAADTPGFIVCQVTLGTDHQATVKQHFAEIRFRETDSALTFEDADGLAGVTDYVYVDASAEYVKGGLSDIMTIPVNTSGEFDYQLFNHATPPHTIVRVISVIPRNADMFWRDLDPASAATPNSGAAQIRKLTGTNKIAIVADFSGTVTNDAMWQVTNPTETIYAVNFYVAWTTDGGTPGEGVYFEILQNGVANDEVWDLGGGNVRGVTDTMIATTDMHTISGAGTASQFDPGHVTYVRLRRVPSNVGDTLVQTVHVHKLTVEYL